MPDADRRALDLHPGGSGRSLCHHRAAEVRTDVAHTFDWAPHQVNDRHHFPPVASFCEEAAGHIRRAHVLTQGVDLTEHTLPDGLASFYMVTEVICPVLHKFAALIEKVGPSVRGLCFVFDHVRQCKLDNLSRMGSCLTRPIAE